VRERLGVYVIEVKGDVVEVKVHVCMYVCIRPLVVFSLPQSLYAPAANHDPALKL
jgi:hypothetical protein